MKKKIVFTGSQGFVGSRILDLLGSKYYFQLFDIDKHSLHKIDSMESLLEGASVVLHFAGANRDSNFGLVNVNTLGTTGLLEATTKYCPGARFIFASSLQAKSEHNCYGLSKHFAEELIALYSRQKSVRGTILRFSNIYGPGCRPNYNSVIATFCYRAIIGEPISINGDGEQKRDYVYIDDIVEIVDRAICLEQEDNYLDIDVCSGHEKSLNDIIGTIENILGHKIPVSYTKSDIVEWHTKNDNSKLKKYLKYCPDFNWEKGIGATLAAFQKELEHD